MVNVICIPYCSFKEKINITKKLSHLNQKYMDLGGLIYYTKNDGVKEEQTTGKLIWLEKNK